MKDRRSFLKDVCPTVAFAFFGISFLEACSSGDEDTDITPPETGTGTGTGSGSGSGSGSGGGSSTNGYTKSENTYTIDLTHNNFKSPGSGMGTGLGTVGGWMNGQMIGIPALFLRISETSIQAYTNVCPHNSNNDRWSLIEDGGKFRCNYHGRTYATDNCTSALKCYNPTLKDNTLTLTIS